MYFKLKSELLLRGWEKLPYAIVNTKYAMPAFISSNEMEVLQLCNGRIDFSLPLISKTIREMAVRFEKAGIVEQCEKGDSIRPEQEYHLYPARYINTAHWSVTGRCNYRCKHCYMSAPDAKLGELSHEMAMKMVDELAECGIMSVTLTGGEALVRSDFLEIVDALLEKNIHISTIYSNGALVNEELLKSLEERRIHPEFNMSFDGIGWHDWLRGIKGAEKTVDRAFRLCRDMGFPTGAEMCLHDQNKHTLRESVLYLGSVGCRKLKTNPVSDIGEWKKTGLGRTLSLEELYQLYLDYVSDYYEDGMPLAIQLGGFFSANPRQPREYDIPMYKFASDPSSICACSHARQVMYISPEGRLLPCMALSGMDIQNLFPLATEKGLVQCLTDSFYLDFINTRAEKILTHNPECAECRFRTWCLCGCRASGLEFSEGTDLYHRDEACCALYCGGWISKLIEKMKKLHPDITSPGSKDKELMDALKASA